MKRNLKNLKSSKIANSISETILFNSAAKHKDNTVIRHVTSKEAFVPVHIGLLIHPAK